MSAPCFVAVGLAFALLTACGGEASGGSGAPAAGAAAGTSVSGAGGQGGAAGSGGSGAGAGVGGSGGAVDRGACAKPSDCVVVPESCCGACGVPSRDDGTAVHRDHAAAHAADACGPGPAACPACARPLDPTLVATCDAGRCRVVDLLATDLTACTSDADCHLRTNECCECGGATDLEHLVAVGPSGNAGMMELLCDPGSGCAKCLPSYPSLPALCSSGRCTVSGGLGGK